MSVVRTVQQIRNAVTRLRSAGRSIALVPTMGALHAGHTSLIDAARRDAHAVVVSIFVNPTQFGPSEDFDAYPRAADADVEVCRKHAVDAVFAPSASAIYPPVDETRVRVGPLAATMCGRGRPGHFDGVCTVVAKLFAIVRPDAAYFGQKDAQQAVIIRRMASDLFLPPRIVVCPIVRGPDGLAMSSRNRFLTPDQRQQAVSLFAALGAGRDRIQQGERRAGVIVSHMARLLRAAGTCDVEYIVVVDPGTLRDVSDIHAPVLLALAVKIGSARLIDNLLVE
ncbi:MAG: pantoate--beta-alanine ligase [Phycisphaerae bacterium]